MLAAPRIYGRPGAKVSSERLTQIAVSAELAARYNDTQPAPAGENPVEILAQQLQSLPPELRWFYAQQDILMAIIAGKLPVRGRWTRRADRVIAVASGIGLGRVLVALVNLLQLAKLYVRQLSIRTGVPVSEPLFVGAGNLHEPHLIRLFEELQGRAACVVDENELPSLCRHYRIGAFALLREWARMWRISWPSLGGAGPHLMASPYLLAHLMVVGHKYSYFLAWFRRHLRTAPSPLIAFSSASNVVSYAAVSAGAFAIYLPHGFQRRTLILPDFAEAYCSNRFEAAHLRRRLPHAKVSVLAEPMQMLETRPVIAIAGLYWDQDHVLFDLCRPLIAWAREAGFAVVVRKHPKDITGYWDQWRDVSGVEVVEKDYGFDFFLEEYRPRLLATWYSTTLFDALTTGVVPVTFTCDDINDVVFPFREIALRWPEDASTIRRLASDTRASAAFVSERYANVIADGAAEPYGVFA